MRRVYISKDKFESFANKLYLLIGQRAEIELENDKTVMDCVVFDHFQCPSIDVALEQVECIERIVPCGLCFLGFAIPERAHDKNNEKKTKTLQEAFSSHTAVDQLFVLHFNKKNDNLEATSLKSNDSSWEVFREDFSFCQLTCTLHAKFTNLPLLVNKDKATITMIELKSGKRVSPLLYNITDAEISQLGVGESRKMVYLPITVCFAHTSGKALYKELFNLVRDSRKYQITEIVEIRSKRNKELLYCWRASRAPKSSDSLTNEEWKQLTEIVEDATGEKITEDQLMNAYYNPAGPRKISAGERFVQLADYVTERPYLMMPIIVAVFIGGLILLLR